MRKHNWVSLGEATIGQLYWAIDQLEGIVLMEVGRMEIGVGLFAPAKVTEQKLLLRATNIEKAHINFVHTRKLEPAGDSLEPSDEFKLLAAAIVGI